MEKEAMKYYVASVGTKTYDDIFSLACKLVAEKRRELYALKCELENVTFGKSILTYQPIVR